MFASGGRVASTPHGDNDDDDWLRVGRSFKSATSTSPLKETSNRERVDERALQVYKKSKKDSKKSKKNKKNKKKKSRKRKSSSNVSSDSASDSSDTERRSREHKRAKKAKAKDTKHHRSSSRHRAKANAYSDSSSSSFDSESSSDRRVANKKRRRHDHDHDDRRSTHRATDDDGDVLALLESPPHGEMEVYHHHNHHQQLQRQGEKEKLFEFDCVGDRDNSFYGSLYKGEQPQYRLATRRSIVDGQWIVDRPKRVATNGADKPLDKQLLSQSRYFGVEARTAERRQGTKRLHLAYSQRRLARVERGNDEMSELPFLPLDAVVDGELNGVNDGGDDDDEQEDDEQDKNDASQALLWQTDLENMERFLVAKNKKLNERVNGDPADVDAWLDLIAFQDEMQRLAGNPQPRKTSNHSAVIVEKQRAVLDKALEKNPRSKRLKRLQLNLLWREQDTTGNSNTNGSSLDVDAYRALVEQMLESDPTNVELWTKLIQCAQQKFGSFSMTMLRDLYARVVAVLHKELTRRMDQESASFKPTLVPATSSSSFIHVVGNKSLLGKTDPYESGDALLDETTSALSMALLMFHQSMARAELSAGFVERAVAQIQALIKFNQVSRCREGTQGLPSHQEMVETFGITWTEATSHFGEQVSSDNVDAMQPSVAQWESFCNVKIEEAMSRVNPPTEIHTREHDAALVAPYAPLDSDQEDENHDEDAAASERIETIEEDRGDASTAKGQWVYSNLHGQRIWIADADETSSYERILSELRGSERFQERQQTQDRKRDSKRERQSNLLAKLCDERAQYPVVEASEDDYLQWLAKETHAEMTQWRPLRSSNPDHAELMEMQPDRAILTEEILPFVFRVPRSLRSHAILNLLAVVGVRLTVAASTHTASSPWTTQTSDDFDDVSILTRPILNALDVASAESCIAMTSRDRYKLVMASIQSHVSVDAVAAMDPDRVQFVRNVFTSAIQHESVKPAGDELVCRLLKVMWMEYEAAVVIQAGAEVLPTVNADKLRAFCQALLHPIETSDGPTAQVDPYLMSVYADIEMRLGNDQQGARVCDKTLAALQLGDSSSSGATASVSRSFHRLIFQRVQQILYSESRASKAAGAPLQALYLMWHVWQPHTVDSLERIMKQHRKKPLALMTFLHEHRNEIKDHVVERYRVELDVALQQCRHKTTPNTSRREQPWRTCDVAFALSNLCSAIYTTRGFQAAQLEYHLFLKDIDPDACHARECWLMFLAFMQSHQASGRLPQVAPRDWRRVVAESVAVFPLDPVCLRLFVDAETSNTISQTLRKYFQARRHAWRRFADSPAVIEWLFALLCEFARAERSGAKLGLADSPLAPAGVSPSSQTKCCVLHRWGKNRPAVERIRRVFEEMVSQVNTSGNAMGWRLYVRFELAVGRVEAARKVFYRGLVKCPWSKALYLDGLRVLRPYLSRDECQEISDFLVAKELHVRVDDDQE